MLNLGQDEEQSKQDWPRLRSTNFQECSPVNYDYNCAAWVVGVTDKPWWPWPGLPYYWPPDAPLEETLDAFVIAYGTLGYIECDTPDLEEGVDKIAVYANVSGLVPSHVALQLSNGHWTSKLGDLKDITHQTLDDLSGGLYGRPARFMRRPRVQEEVR